MLIGAHDLGYRHASASGDGQQGVAAQKWIGQHGAVGHDTRRFAGGGVFGISVFLRHHKSATHRKIAPLLQQAPCCVQSHELHAIGVEGQGFAPQKQYIAFFCEGNRVAAVQLKDFFFADFFQPRIDGVRVYAVGHQAFQAQHHSGIGAVAFAGGAQRAV